MGVLRRRGIHETEGRVGKYVWERKKKWVNQSIFIDPFHEIFLLLLFQKGLLA